MYALLARSNNSHALTEDIAFAALGLFSLQQAPLVNLVTCFEDIQTLVTSFRRTQEYIMSDERTDARSVLERSVALTEDNSLPETAESNELGGKTEEADEQQLRERNLVATLRNARGGYVSDKAVLEDVDLDVSRDKITMVIGPV